MASNGGQQQYMDDGQATSEYNGLVEMGLNENVAYELDGMIQAGMMTRDEVDQRAIEALKAMSPEDGLGVLEQLKSSNLASVTNKSAYMCSVMKSYRQKQASGMSSAKRPGPDEAKLKEILDRTGYPIEITSGQRKYGGPPPNYNGPNPGPGQEVFLGKLPTSVFEDSLIPLLENCGTIWDLRLMMDPATGLNKTFCFCTFTNKAGAQEAVRQLDNYEIRPGKRIKVNVSIAKVRLFVGNIPKQRSKDDIYKEFSKVSEGLKEVIVYANPEDPNKLNRGFCFLDYDCHKNAAAAKRKMEQGGTAWNRQFAVTWAEPQDEPDEETMAKVKVLYVKNLTASVSEDDLRATFEPYGSIERVKKTKDYGFVHFDAREDALRAMEALNGTLLADAHLDISLAKPPSKKQQNPPQFGGSDRFGGQQRGGSRGRGRGMRGGMGGGMGMGGGAYSGGYGGGYDQYAGGSYDSYGGGYDDYGYGGGYDDYSGGYNDYYDDGSSYGMGGYGAAAGGYGRGRGASSFGGQSRGSRGSMRGGASRGASIGGGVSRGVRGGRGAPSAPRGAPRGGIVGGRGAGAPKRKAPDGYGSASGYGSAPKKPMMGGGGYQQDWSTQPITQQPLGGGDWYQDSWN